MHLLWILTLTETALFHRSDDADAIFVDDDTRIQVLDTMSWLPRADKEQCGAFIVSPHLWIDRCLPLM